MRTDVRARGPPQPDRPAHASPSLAHVSHPVQAYLNGLAPSSRRPQLSALDWIVRRSTQVFTAETLPISACGALIGAAVPRLRAAGFAIDDADIAHLGPTMTEHLNVHGRYRFDLDGRPKGLRPVPALPR
jgi:hypothetical protein